MMSFLNPNKNYEKEKLKWYFKALSSPYESLEKLKQEIQAMRQSTSNLRKYEAIVKGFLDGLTHRQRLAELERAKKSPSREIGRER